MQKRTKVLIACEFSGIVRQAFRKRGFDAWSCDLLPAEDGSPYHLQCDVREVLADGWLLMIAHPPCTYLCLSGVRWLYERPERWQKLQEAIEFFKELLNAPIPHIAVENPTMHRFALQQLGRPSQCFQPYEFGEPVSKRTCLWLRNLPPLLATKILHKDKAQQRIWKCPPSPNRWKERSRSFPKVAEAMAHQWGDFLISRYGRQVCQAATEALGGN